MAAVPLAQVEDVANVWRAIESAEVARVEYLIDVASAKLRARCPFDLDARIGLFTAVPSDPLALDPVVVTNVVATIVKRVMVNPEGLASTTQTFGPFSESRTFAGRNESSASGDVEITAADLAELAPRRAPGPVRTLSIGLTDNMWPEPAYRTAYLWPNGW
jgi:hypothetical protein